MVTACQSKQSHLFICMSVDIMFQDDLRKDARLMEFNAIVNKCLRKDPESRRRDLHIRTYVRLFIVHLMSWND